MSRISVAAVAEPKEWEAIRVYCFSERKAVGRFMVEAALAYIEREQKKGAKK